MATKNISNRSVAALRCPPGKDRVFLWDDALAGFGVVAYASGKKVYVFQYRHNRRSHRMKLGAHGAMTPDQARHRATKKAGEVADEKDPIAERRKERDARTFKDVADEYMRLHVEPKCKSRTADEYERLLRLHILPSIGSKRILDVQRPDIARMHSKMVGTPGAANRCLALISGIWNWAGERDEVQFADNPAKRVKRNPEKAKERFLTSNEIARLGDAIRTAETKGIPWEVDETAPNAKHIGKKRRHTIIDPHAATAIRLLILTGARLREILDARWDYVDWERGLLMLPDSKTGKKVIYLSAPALAVLQDLPRVHGNPYIIAGHGPHTKATGAPLEGQPRADLKKPWAAVAKHAGLDGVRLHDLRHSFASIGAGASLGLPIIGKLLGHTQAATTQRYSHLDADPLRRAANLIGGQIAAALEGKSGEVMPMKASRARQG